VVLRYWLTSAFLQTEGSKRTGFTTSPPYGNIEKSIYQNSHYILIDRHETRSEAGLGYNDEVCLYVNYGSSFFGRIPAPQYVVHQQIKETFDTEYRLIYTLCF
jgi:hypothetical protein